MCGGEKDETPSEQSDGFGIDVDLAAALEDGVVQSSGKEGCRCAAQVDIRMQLELQSLGVRRKYLLQCGIVQDSTGQNCTVPRS